MLEFELTPHHTGLPLRGDHVALVCLYDLVGRIVEDKEGFVLASATIYLRKAYGRPA